MNKLKFLKMSIIIILIILVACASYLLITHKKTNVCQSLGCPDNTIYVGSINSNKYYTCDCQYAKRIKSENIICFSSDSEALEKNYIKVDC
jgi:lipopolysaccharide export system protein LptC